MKLCTKKVEDDLSAAARQIAISAEFFASFDDLRQRERPIDDESARRVRRLLLAAQDQVAEALQIMRDARS